MTRTRIKRVFMGGGALLASVPRTLVYLIGTVFKFCSNWTAVDRVIAVSITGLRRVIPVRDPELSDFYVLDVTTHTEPRHPAAEARNATAPPDELCWRRSRPRKKTRPRPGRHPEPYPRCHRSSTDSHHWINHRATSSGPTTRGSPPPPRATRG